MSARFPLLPDSDPMCATHYYANVALDLTDRLAAEEAAGALPRDPRMDPGWVEFFHALDKARRVVRCSCVITPNGYTCLTVEMRKRELARFMELNWYRGGGTPILFPVPPPLFMASDAVTDTIAEMVMEDDMQSSQAAGQSSSQARVPCFYFGQSGPCINPTTMPWNSFSSASCCDALPLPAPSTPPPSSKKRKAPVDTPM